jgi:hypothetical protein
MDASPGARVRGGAGRVDRTEVEGWEVYSNGCAKDWIRAQIWPQRGESDQWKTFGATVDENGAV